MSYVFGRQSTAGVSVDYNADELVASRFQNNGGTTTIRSLWMYGIVDVSDNARLAIYESGTSALLGETGNLPSGTGYVGADLLAEVSVTNGSYYYLALHCGSVVRLVDLHNTPGEVFVDASSQTYASGAPDPLPADEDNYPTLRILNIYADDTWINPPASDYSAAMLLSL